MSRRIASWILVTVFLSAGLCAQELRLRLTVLDDRGQPLAGALVGIAEAGERILADLPPASRQRSDAAGRIYLRSGVRGSWMPPGTRPPQLLVAAAGFSSRSQSLIALLNRAARLPMQDPRADFDLGSCRMRRAVTLRGRVRDASGRPLVRALVVAESLIAGVGFHRYGRLPGSEWAEVAAAHSDAKGRVTLPDCAADGLRLRVVAPGYQSIERLVLEPSGFLDLNLLAGHWARGRVLDDQGRPVVGARIQLLSEGRETRYHLNAWSHSGAEGRFAVPIDAPGRWLLVAQRRPLAGQYRTANVRSGIHRGDAADLELSLPAQVGEVVDLRVVAAAGGQPVTGIRAYAQKINSKYFNPQNLHAGLAYAFQRDDGQGQLRLNLRTSNGDETVALIVAPGYAPQILRKLSLSDPAKPARKPQVVRLHPGARITGQLVDAATGRPVAGAQVRVQRVGFAGQLPYWTRVLPSWAGRWAQTDAAGRFVADSLVPGNYRVQPRVPGKPTTDAQLVSTKVEEPPADLRFALGGGATLRGRLLRSRDHAGVEQALKVGKGWKVSLGDGQSRVFYPGLLSFSGPIGFTDYRFQSVGYLSFGGGDLEGGVQPDGSFVIPGVGRGRYRLGLQIPPLGIRERPYTVQIEPLRCRGVDLQRRVPLDGDLPGILRGRVKLRGARFRPGQLMVCSLTHGNAPSYLRFNPSYFRCLVGPDGRFVFRAKPGPQRLFLLDLIHGTVMYVDEQVRQVKPGTEQQLEIELELTHLRLRLEIPEQAVVSRIEWQVVTSLHKLSSGIGRSRQLLGRELFGEKDLLLTLPVGELHMVAWSQAQLLDPSNQETRRPLATKVLQLRPGELNQLRLEIPAPLPLAGEGK